MKIRFIASRGPRNIHGLVRWIIRARTQSPWSHCVVVLSDGQVVEAGHRHGVAMGNFAFPYAVQVEDIVLDLDERIFLEWVTPRLGMPFDLLAMTAQLIPVCRWQRKGAYYCSTLIAEFLEHEFGFCFSRCHTPSTLYAFLLLQNEVKIDRNYTQKCQGRTF